MWGMNLNMEQIDANTGLSHFYMFTTSNPNCNLSSFHHPINCCKNHVNDVFRPLNGTADSNLGLVQRLKYNMPMCSEILKDLI